MRRTAPMLCHVVPNVVPARILRGSRIGLACATLLLGTLGHKTASACAAATPRLEGFPDNGASGVPTDVVPFYDAFGDLAQVKFSLTTLVLDKTGFYVPGEAVGVKPEAAQGVFNLVLEKTLEPNTTYTLTASLPPTESPNEVVPIMFTTGNGPLSTPPAPPRASLQHFRFVHEISIDDCSSAPTLGTCVAVSAGLPVEATEIDRAGNELQPRLLRYSWITNLTGIDPSTNQPNDSRPTSGGVCIKLRARAANATYSAPVVVCGADAPFFTLGGGQYLSCDSQGLSHEGALVTASDPLDDASSASGCACSLAPGNRNAANTTVIAVLGLAIFRRGLRRARSRSLD